MAKINFQYIAPIMTFSLGMYCTLSIAQTNYVISSKTTPSTTSKQLSEWHRIVDAQQGVEGKDPVGHKIGPNVAKRRGLGLNWYPVDIYKQTLCGTLHHFNFYDGYGDEADWNNFIIPSSHHAYILEDVKPIADPDQLHTCQNNADCMEAEITPDEHLYENPWFSKNAGSSSLEGREICTYGPWVWEEAHGNRPEIHPSELYWWKETIDPKNDTYMLMVIQDDSNRFDRVENYSGSVIRPWSKVERTGQFKIAFELPIQQISQNQERLVFDIDEASRNVVTKNDAKALQDADDGKNHAIQLDGTIVLEVNEPQSTDNNIGVRFTEITRGFAGGSGIADGNEVLRGYVTLTTKIGINDRGKEGYHIIRVRSRRVSGQGPVVQPLAAITINARPEERVKIMPMRESLRVEMVDGQPKLIGDLQGKDPSGKFVGSKTRVSAMSGTIAEIPSATGTLKFEAPKISLAPFMKVERKLRGTGSGVRWESIAKAVGSTQLAGTLPPTISRVDKAYVSVTPFYAPERDGKPAREDDSPFVEELNKALEKRDTQRIKNLFASDRPIKQVNWSFTAKNLSNGETMPVEMGAATSNQIRVIEDPTATMHSKIIVSFPPAPQENVLEVTATAMVVDTFGNNATVSTKVWSHVLTADKKQLPDNVIIAAGDLADIDANRLMTASKIMNLPNDDANVKEPFMRCARMLRLYALRSAEDGSVDIGELNSAKRIAERCKSL